MIAHLSITHVSLLAAVLSGAPYTGTCSSNLATLIGANPSATLYELHGASLKAVNVITGFTTPELARSAWEAWRANGNSYPFPASEYAYRHAAATTQIPIPRAANAQGYSAQRVEIICFQWLMIELDRAWFFTNEGLLLDIAIDTPGPKIFRIITPGGTLIVNALL